MLQMFLPMAEFDVFLRVAAQHKIVNLNSRRYIQPFFIVWFIALVSSVSCSARRKNLLGPRDPKRIGLAE